MSNPNAHKISLSDALALEKFATREWIPDLSTGRIYHRKECRYLPQSATAGYKTVHLSKNNIKTAIFVHHAIWIAAHGIIPEGYEIDHINNNKTDNRLENLQLLTRSENTCKNRNSLTYRQAEEIRARFAEGHITKSALAKQYRCGKTTIARIIRKETYLRQIPSEQTQEQNP